MWFKQFMEHKESNRYEIYKHEVTKICKNRGYMLKNLGSVAGEYNIHAVIINPRATATIGFSGTIHGDEIAGVCSVLEFLKRVKVPSDVRIFAIPLTNPLGFQKQRHSGMGTLNINRQFNAAHSKYEAGIIKRALVRQPLKFFHTLHEDGGARGFYMYYFNEAIVPQCRAILSIAEQFFPLDDRDDIYGDEPEERGLIRTDPRKVPDKKTLEVWLHQRGIDNICTETPRLAALEDRVECEIEIMKYVAEAFFR